MIWLVSYIFVYLNVFVNHKCVIIIAMKKELDFLKIDGTYYGGDQNWHTHHMMKLGGCSAICACEQCIQAARSFACLRALYPYDPLHVTKENFLRFFETMFQYIHPGIGGLTSIEKFERMFRRYTESAGVAVELEKLDGHADIQEAKKFVKNAIDDGVPVMYLMLKHADPVFDEFEWHWFNLTGYETSEDAMQTTFATWGKKCSFDFVRAWDTGKFFRGGMLRIDGKSLK